MEAESKEKKNLLSIIAVEHFIDSYSYFHYRHHHRVDLPLELEFNAFNAFIQLNYLA